MQLLFQSSEEDNARLLGLIERLGLHEVNCVVRVSMVHYNTREEVDRLIEALGKMSGHAFGRALGGGFLAFALTAAGLALAAGLATAMPSGTLL